MGKLWLTAVKRAFRSPNKDTHKKSKTRDDPEQEDQDRDKRDRRRWIFRKPANQETLVSTQMKAKFSSTADQAVSVVAVAATTDQKHAVAVAVATTQATTEAARLNNHIGIGRDGKQYAAIVIQTAFRGYLARRALRALKGLVKLLALVRGHNVRKQAKMTLRCMQALVRLQSRVLDHRTRLPHEGGSSSRISTFSDTNSLWESPYLQGISDRKSLSREGSSIASDWDERPHTVEEVKAMLHKRKEAAMKRDKSLSQAFSQQIWRNGNEDELEERPKPLERWMTMKPWESNRGRASTDRRDPIKTVEIDTSQPYSYLGPNYRRRSHPNYQYNPQSHQPQTHRHSVASPHHRTSQNVSIQHSPATPSPAKSRPIQVRSASPRCSGEDRSYHTSQTPNLRLNNNHHNYSGNGWLSRRAGTSSNGGASLPNYMAATESAKARIRSQSAPRQRAPTPERDRVGSARKRLSYPAHHLGMGYAHSLRSPSFKSVSGSHFGLEQQSNYSSCCTDSLAGESSPSSTGDLRR